MEDPCSILIQPDSIMLFTVFTQRVVLQVLMRNPIRNLRSDPMHNQNFDQPGVWDRIEGFFVVDPSYGYYFQFFSSLFDNHMVNHKKLVRYQVVFVQVSINILDQNCRYLFIYLSIQQNTHR